MVRPSGTVLTYLPEPPGWRAHPPGRLPADPPDPCWSLDPAPPAEGSRPLAIVEVVDYDLSALGTSRIVKLDPVGVLAERLGDVAVQCVRRALRDSWTYPTLATAGDALLNAIFGERGPSGWLFEVVVSPHVYASRTLWNTQLLGRRKQLKTYRGREFELDTSPDLACCNMDVLHPVSRPPSDARRHWTLRICQITPLVRRGLSDREAEAALQQLLDKARRRPKPHPRLSPDAEHDVPPAQEVPRKSGAVAKGRGRGERTASPPERLSGDTRPKPAKPRQKLSSKAKLQIGHVVFLHPDRLPLGASPHQPHLILAEAWPIRGERGGSTRRHFRLQPQPSGEPFLLEERTVTALHNGFRAAWLAMEAAGDAAQRETLLRALAWYCEEYARPPLACIRLLLHSGTVSREQALELAAEMRALTGGGGEAYASDGEEPAGARPSPRRGCEEAPRPC